MAAEKLIQVDRDNCTKCGYCVNVCRGTLRMGTDGPEVIGDFCIACGHCVAVCPNNALNHRLAPLSKQIPIEKTPVLDADAAACFLRSRRSNRNFQKRRIPREKIRELLDIARFTHTACNSQGISYHVVDDQDTLKAITAAIADWAENDLKHGALGKSPWSGNTANTSHCYREKKEDTILYDAPCLVIAIVDKERLALGRDNAHFGLTYVQLYASALGLGSCWSGLFEYCASAKYEPLLKLLRLPKGKAVTGATLIGYPLYVFQKLVDRDPIDITWQ